MLVQITERRGKLKRVPIGKRPSVVELELEPGQYVVSFKWTSFPGARHRKTEDWTWTAIIATPIT